MPTAYWRPLSDPFFDHPFIVMPLTGSLISIGCELESFLARRAARVAGLRGGTRRPDAFFARKAVRDTARVADAASPASARIRQLVRVLLACFPLGVAVRLLGVACPLRRTGGGPVSEATLALLAASFGRRSRDDCLEMALCRYALMRREGHRCAIVIGLLVPSDKMHAWIEHDGHPLLECEDVLVHYQACLAFVDEARR